MLGTPNHSFGLIESSHTLNFTTFIQNRQIHIRAGQGFPEDNEYYQIQLFAEVLSK